jgi:AcrR family transcriptional regulator
MPDMKIAELVRRSGVARSTVHHYLNLGLLPPPLRRGPKLHLYSDAHLERLIAIHKQQQRGLSLKQIGVRLAQRERAVEKVPSAAREREREPATRRRILDVAARLFTEQGWENVPMAAIARAAAVGKATLYQRWRSKSALFLECLDRLTESITATKKRPKPPDAPSLRSALAAHAAETIAAFPSLRMMISALGEAAFGRDRRVAARARVAFLRLATAGEPLLERAIASGRARRVDAQLVAYMMWGALVAVGARLAHGDRRYSPADGLEIYLDFVTRGIASHS